MAWMLCSMVRMLLIFSHSWEELGSAENGVLRRDATTIDETEADILRPWRLYEASGIVIES